MAEDDREGLIELSVLSPAGSPCGKLREQLCHIVQDEAGCSKIHAEVLPPEEYYERLKLILLADFPKADPSLVEHIV